MKPEFWMGRMVYFPADVDPLIEAKDKEIKRLGSQLKGHQALCEEKCKWFLFRAEKAEERISELEAEIARLRDLCEVYVPADERAGTPDQTRM